MVMEVLDEDLDMDMNMSCTDHPYKNQTAGGICALCLQDKLGKLVSSSFHSSVFPASATSSISSPSEPGSVFPPRAKPLFLAKKEEKSVSIVFQRSKSTVVNRTRGFWSFLALNRVRALPGGGGAGLSFRQGSLRERREEGDADDERKVSRSRSVGCGSRSFSGDFFERISTGFGDCTLRRVESQCEGKPKNTPVRSASTGAADRVRCGRIFGGFSSSMTNWSHASPVDAVHGRTRSWGWALVSPMRAFSKPKRDRKRNNANVTPNLNAIPSLLAVGG